MLQSYKFRLYPNKEQQIFFAKTFGCVRFVYNLMLSDKIKAYEETGKIVTFTPAMYKEDYPFLKEVDSLALCNAQMNLQSAYNNFFRDKSVGFPKYKSKKDNHKSYTTNNLNGHIRIVDKHIKLPNLVQRDEDKITIKNL